MVELHLAVEEFGVGEGVLNSGEEAEVFGRVQASRPSPSSMDQVTESTAFLRTANRRNREGEMLCTE